MKTLPASVSLALTCAAGLLVLPACKSKADARKIKDLEVEQADLNETIEALQEEFNVQLENRDEQTAKLEAEFEKELAQLRKERDEALAQHQQAASTLRQMEARVANLPQTTRASVTGEVVATDAGLDPAKQQAVVLITGDVTKGTGFIVGIGEKRYLYTAAHVLSGNQRLTISGADGRKFTKFGPLEVAEGADLVRLEILDAGDAPFLTLAEPTDQIASGTAIVALGNSGGAGVISTEKGTILGQSAESLEVSAAVIQGNSGGPVLDASDGSVLGMVTHLSAQREDLWSEGTRFGEVRRFACRLNREWKWQAVPIMTFLGEAKRIADFDRLTRVGLAVASLSPTPEGLRVDSQLPGGQDAIAVLSAAQDLPFVAEIIKMNTELSARRMRSSEADLNRRFRSMIDTTAGAVKRSGDGFDPEKFTWFHRQQALASAEWRRGTDEALRKSSEALNP